MEIIWYTGLSMDAKLASAEHELEFLESIGQDDQTRAAFPTFYASIDAIVIGAETLRWLVRGGHGWPHGEKPTWVVTHDAALVAGIGKTEAPLRRVEGELQPMLDELRRSGAKRVWVCGGGELAGQLLALDAIDTVDVVIAPVALGAGPALFGQRALAPRMFRVATCEVVGGNAVHVVWRRDRNAG
jgi:riboflavin biosynthesis pyrimidine reductase